MRAVGTLTDPTAPDKIKMPRWDIFILSWLCCLYNLQAELLGIVKEIKGTKEL